MARKKDDQTEKKESVKDSKDTSKEGSYQKKEQNKESDYQKKDEKPQDQALVPNQPRLPPELEEKLKSIKDKVDKFKKAALEKFDKYIIGIALLPPPRPGDPALVPEIDETGKPLPPPDPNKINLLVLVDDTEPSKMPKFELRDKLASIIETIAKETDPSFAPQTILLSEVWQSCYDGKYDLLQLIAISAPFYDKGMLAAIRIAEIHKQMVLRKFEKYIVAYVLAGSLVQGKATPQSDIDVFVIIDDTDVKKMTRGELKDKLRAIIMGMGMQAGDETGVHNKINIQVYILTDFWESVREANPVIFTFLRDGIPFYDRGIFMPWKQLLKMGKIRPSAEAIDMYMSSGEQVLDRVRIRLKEIGIEDFFWATLTPSQAAIMMYGVPPPTPKETPAVMREVFVKKLKLMTDSEVDILQNIIQVRKDLEHGTKKEVTGKEIDSLIDDADKYLKRLKRLFGQIEKIKEEEAILQVYDGVVTVARDILKLEGREKVTTEEILHVFEDELISTGKLAAKHLRELHDLIKAKESYEKGSISKTEIDQVRKEGAGLLRTLVDYVQSKRGKDLERAKVRAKYGDKVAEIILLDKQAYVIRDIDSEERIIEKTSVTAAGGIDHAGLSKANIEEFEHAIATAKIPPKVFLKNQIFEDLKKLFGKDVEVLVSN